MAADRQELPQQLQARLRALARAEEQVGRQDVHPGQGDPHPHPHPNLYPNLTLTLSQTLTLT